MWPSRATPPRPSRRDSPTALPPVPPMTVTPPDERRFAASSALVWGLGVTQLVGWGTLYFAFSLFVEPMEAELGWSRADLNGALAAGLLAGGLAAIPVGQWIDRRGGHALMTLGAAFAAVLLALWSQVDTLAGFY